jgi:hypothetical protein
MSVGRRAGGERQFRGTEGELSATIENLHVYVAWKGCVSDSHANSVVVVDPRLALPACFCVWLSTEQSCLVRQVQTAACAIGLLTAPLLC